MSSVVTMKCRKCEKKYPAKTAEIKRGKGFFCSVVCYHDFKRPFKIERPCEVCGVEMLITHQQCEDKRFCSRSCYDRFQKEINLKKCEHCGKEMEKKPGYYRLRFCSIRCSV